MTFKNAKQFDEWVRERDADNVEFDVPVEQAETFEREMRALGHEVKSEPRFRDAARTVVSRYVFNVKPRRQY